MSRRVGTLARRRADDAPRLDPVEPRGLTEADASALRGGERLDGLLVTGDAAGAALHALALDECVLSRVALDDAVLDGVRIGDSVLERVTATSVRGARLALRDVRIDGCRFGAAEWFESTWDRVLVTGCQIDYLGLADAALSDVRFADCTIGELDLRGARVARVAVEDCRVASLSLTGAQLSGFDLRGADLERIDSAAGLKGAIVSDAQLPRLAPLLAEALGITVR